MTEAINIFFTIFNEFLDFLFNDCEIVTGVTLGWVLIFIMVMGLLLTALLNIRKGNE